MDTSFALPVEHRPGYRSWLTKGRKWELWRESDNRPAFATYYRTKQEALEAQAKSDDAAIQAWRRSGKPLTDLI